MTNEEYNKIIAEIETLPTGGITYKKINGKEYAYYQWREDGNLSGNNRGRNSRRVDKCNAWRSHRTSNDGVVDCGRHLDLIV